MTKQLFDIISCVALLTLIAPNLPAISRLQTVLIQDYGGQYLGQTRNRFSSQYSGQYAGRWIGQYAEQKTDQRSATANPANGRSALDISSDDRGDTNAFVGDGIGASQGAPAASIPCWSIYNGAGC